MKKILSSIAAIILMAAASQAFAQNSRIATTITTEKHDPNFALGRDFWFAPAQNYLDEPGKYFRIYITSPNNTNAYVESQGIIKNVPIPAYGIGTYTVPLSWEMKSSGVVENKAIHVYDPTDDISVCFMSHNQYSGDGMYCIPTIGWGTDYLVASYESLYESGSTYIYDFPSEFTITANQDNTIIDITPSTGLRYVSVFPGSNPGIEYPQGQKFSVTLDRGQCIQYQSADATDITGFDVTGTIIHSNNPVCVVGGSMCPNIPVGFSYCDYITDMIPPVRTWGETYYTTNATQPAGDTSHNYAMYLIISSKTDQTIYRYNQKDSVRKVATLGQVYDHYFVEVENANKFYSDAPFLLVQYMNSSSYPDTVMGNGNPAEVVIPARENFAKTTLLLTPTGAGAQSPFDVYANIIVRAGDEKNVTFDGKSITSYTHQAIDDTFEIYIIPHVAQDAHEVRSDSGVGAYIYGYGYEESFAWGAPSKVGTFNSPDIIPPAADVSSQCFGTTVHLTDTGILASKLSEMRLDTDINMAYEPDLYPNWIDGVGFDTSGFSMFVVDMTKPALLLVSVFDFAGNRTTIRSSYSPQIASISPALQDFGVGFKGDPRVVLYDTLVNFGNVPFTIDSLRLLYGNRGFTIDSADTKDPLPVGGRRLIKISFSSVQIAAAVDTVIFGDECFVQTSALLGFSGAPDFYVSDVVWQNVPLNAAPGGPNNPMGLTAEAAVIHNLSKSDTLHVSSRGWSDRLHFAFADTLGGPQTLPVAVPPGSTANVWFWFAPTDIGLDTTRVSWSAPEVLNSDSSISIRFNELTGNAGEAFVNFTGDSTADLDCPDTSIHFVYLAFLLSNSGNENAIVASVTVTNPASFTNLTLHDQHGQQWNPAGGSLEALPAGAIDTIMVDFPVTPFTSMSGTTKIFAKDISGDIIGDTLTATVNVNYASAQVSPVSIDFGTVPWMGAKVSQSFTITDTGSGNLEIESIDYIPGVQFNSSYFFTTLPQLPDTLTTGQTMTVTVTFDPSVIGNPVQNTQLIFDWNACNSPAIDLSASLSGSGVAEERAPQSEASVIRLDDGRSIHVTIPNDWTPPVSMDIYNILGEKVFSSSFDATALLDLGTLPRGVYFYRLRDGESSQTGKILLGQ